MHIRMYAYIGVSENEICPVMSTVFSSVVFVDEQLKQGQSMKFDYSEEMTIMLHCNVKLIIERIVSRPLLSQ